jgi:hypothetical protein
LSCGELVVRTGRLQKAIEWGRQAVRNDDLCEDLFWRIVVRGVLANALHSAGEVEATAGGQTDQLAEAETSLERAERSLNASSRAEYIPRAALAWLGCGGCRVDVM